MGLASQRVPLARVLPVIRQSYGISCRTLRGRGGGDSQGGGLSGSTVSRPSIQAAVPPKLPSPPARAETVSNEPLELPHTSWTVVGALEALPP